MIRSSVISGYNRSRHMEDAVKKLLREVNRLIAANHCAKDHTGLPGLYKNNPKKIIFIAPVLSQDVGCAMARGADLFMNELVNKTKIKRLKKTL